MNKAYAEKYEIGEDTLTSELEKSKITLLRKNLTEAEIDIEYQIVDISTDDEELKSFLFSLGCYKGETVTIISYLSENFVISVKDARYSIDSEIARAILI